MTATRLNGSRAWLATAFAALAASALPAFEYNVRMPSDDLKPTFHAADTKPGVWTLAVEDAISKAKANGKYTILMNTGSWWCPYCQTLEELVLTSDAWKSYVAENGFYLAMMDFPYRTHVSEDQTWKSYHPELGDGWGFKCWLMNPVYLSEIGLSPDEGLAAIMSEYEMQAGYALASGAPITIKRWDTQQDFTYNKLGYPTLIVIGPDGKVAGRGGFPWWNAGSVTQREAQEYVIQMLERIIVGECEICQDEAHSVVDVSKSHKYNGWLVGSDGALAGTLDIWTSRYNGRTKSIKARVKAAIAGSKISFRSVEVPVPGCLVCGDDVTLGTVEVEKDGCRAVITIGADGLTGSFSQGDESFTVKGGCNLFNERDAQSRAIAAACPVGTWSIVIKNAEAEMPSPFARGYGVLAMEVKPTGRVRFSGVMGDGTRVSYSSQIVLGSDGIACAPFAARLYGNKGGLSFAVWFKDGKLFSVESVSKWVAAGRNPFDAAVDVQSTMSAGIGVVPAEMDLVIKDSPEEISGQPLSDDQSSDIVNVSGKRWSGTDVTNFKASCTGRSGLLNGSMTFRVLNDRGVEKKVRGTFKGIVMGGAGYGTVIVKGVGTWAVKIAACGSCSD